MMVVVLLAAALIPAGFIFQTNCPEIESYTQVDRLPSIKPDYSDTVIPPNIAPLNFVIREKGPQFVVKIYTDPAEPVTVHSDTGSITIPLRSWRNLLRAGAGKKLQFEIYAGKPPNQWKKYRTIINTIAAEPIDSHLVYRFMKPIFNWWKSIGIYQRNLENYETSVVLHGKSFGDGCLNCHSFVHNRPDTMTIGTRSSHYGSSTLLWRNDRAQKIGSKWGYTAWHPSGRLAAYSLNKVTQFFHTAGLQIRDVVDLDSAIAYYLVESRQVKTIPAIADKDRLETYPAWSPDGKYLYYCSAPILWTDRDQVPPEDYSDVKYDLRRVSYDVDTDTWGESETVLSAEKTGLSILLPRISPDGRFLLFCMCQYGCFPVYQPTSDLYLMDLSTGDYRKLGVNSDYSESWHSWSSNSRWIVFSSKRFGGFFTRSFFSYVDENGRASKPFVLPQKDPAYYDSLLETFSVPELITGPVESDWRRLAWAARGSVDIEVNVPITGATTMVEASDPWRQRE